MTRSHLLIKLVDAVEVSPVVPTAAVAAATATAAAAATTTAPGTGFGSPIGHADDLCQVSCTNKSSGCTKTAKRSVMRVHENEECQYSQMPCSMDGCTVRWINVPPLSQEPTVCRYVRIYVCVELFQVRRSYCATCSNAT